MASSSRSPSLKALVVFRNLMYTELIRSVHVYRLEEGGEEEVEREYVFSWNSDYQEIGFLRVFTLDGFSVSRQFEGMVNGIWLCIYVFDLDRDCGEWNLNRIPLLSGNPKLESIPTLADDLHMISELSSRMKNKEPLQISSDNASEGGSDSNNNVRSTRYVVDLDLNSLPQAESDYEGSDQSAPDVGDKKKKRADTKHIATLSLEDLAKYFDVPIIVAAKKLNVGLTILKKKCRQFGIPRWPHRKIKSLDSLIRDLQEEVEKNKEEDEETRELVAIKKRIIESEKENIEQRPFMDLQREIKRFRQDIFKKRHKARVHEIQSRTLKLF